MRVGWHTKKKDGRAVGRLHACSMPMNFTAYMASTRARMARSIAARVFAKRKIESETQSRCFPLCFGPRAWSRSPESQTPTHATPTLMPGGIHLAGVVATGAAATGAAAIAAARRWGARSLPALSLTHASLVGFAVALAATDVAAPFSTGLLGKVRVLEI